MTVTSLPFFAFLGVTLKEPFSVLSGTVTAYLGVLLPPPPEEEPELEGLVTVTAQVAVFSPAFAVIVALPAATAVTTPFSTVATAVSLLSQITVLSVAVVGNTVAVSVSVAPFTRESCGLFNVMLSTEIVLGVTVTSQLASFPPMV